eukprot:747642-Hanusia_phi.AAC.4
MLARRGGKTRILHHLLGQRGVEMILAHELLRRSRPHVQVFDRKPVPHVLQPLAHVLERAQVGGLAINSQSVPLALGKLTAEGAPVGIQGRAEAMRQPQLSLSVVGCAIGKLVAEEGSSRIVKV